MRIDKQEDQISVDLVTKIVIASGGILLTLIMLFSMVEESMEKQSESDSEIFSEDEYNLQITVAIGGLTRYMNSKNVQTSSNKASAESSLFNFDTIASIVESIKSQI